MSELIQKYGTKMAQLIKLLGELLKKKDNRIIIFSQWDGMLHKVRSLSHCLRTMCELFSSSSLAVGLSRLTSFCAGGRHVERESYQQRLRSWQCVAGNEPTLSNHLLTRPYG